MTAEPCHPDANWNDQRAGETGMRVAVRCPDCRIVRYALAKVVRYKIVRGTFSGRCRKDAARRARTAVPDPPHPAVDWSTFTPDRRPMVTVTCPVCQQRRPIDA